MNGDQSAFPLGGSAVAATDGTSTSSESTQGSSASQSSRSSQSASPHPLSSAQAFSSTDGEACASTTSQQTPARPASSFEVLGATRLRETGIVDDSKFSATSRSSKSRSSAGFVAAGETEACPFAGGSRIFLILRTARKLTPAKLIRAAN